MKNNKRKQIIPQVLAVFGHTCRLIVPLYLAIFLKIVSVIMKCP